MRTNGVNCMKYSDNQELQNLYLLQKALQRDDKAEIKRYRALTSVSDDYQALCEKMRFLEIGMVSTYHESVALYKKEKQMLKERDEANRKAQQIHDKAFAELVKYENILYEPIKPLKRRIESAYARLENSKEQLEEANRRYNALRNL